MPRNEKTKKKNALHRAASAVMRLFSRGQMLDDSAQAAEPQQEQQQPIRTRPRPAPVAARPARREADVPLDLIERAYTPPLTSSKASFRSDGTDHQRDQDFPIGRAENEWNDEDRYTNKSGDPRIGTHRRTYEPDEARAEHK